MQHFIATFGYPAIFVLMVAESACIPIPSELTMLFGGALANASFAEAGRMSAMTVSGFEIANVQLGGDFTVASVLRLGPFAAATLGDYSTASFAANGARTAGGIEDQALHSWFMIGLRGQYDL